MTQLAISELTTLRWTLEEDVEQYAAVGVAGIGVWRHKLAEFGEEKGAELIAEAGLAVSSLQWAGGFTGSDGRSHEESLDDARQAIRAAELLRAGCLIVHSGARGGHTSNHSRRIFRQALDRLLPVAEERGVTLAIEPMPSCGGANWTFLNCLDESLDLITTCNSSALKLALDTYHWGHRSSFWSRLADLVPYLAMVQLGDSREPHGGEPDRVPLGEGSLPLRDIVSALSSAGYDGFYEVELMGEEIEAADYCDLLHHSARTFADWCAATIS